MAQAPTEQIIIIISGRQERDDVPRISVVGPDRYYSGSSLFYTSYLLRRALC